MVEPAIRNDSVRNDIMMKEGVMARIIIMKHKEMYI